MRLSLTLMVMLFFVFGCSNKTTPTQSSNFEPPKVVLTAEEEKAQAVTAGQAIYVAKCGNCHALKKTEDYSADRWTGIMEVMAIKAKLNESEKANVLAYVQLNSRQGG